MMTKLTSEELNSVRERYNQTLQMIEQIKKELAAIYINSIRFGYEYHEIGKQYSNLREKLSHYEVDVDVLKLLLEDYK